MAAMERSGPGLTMWILVAIMVLMVGGMAVTIGISLHHDVASGYIPVDQR